VTATAAVLADSIEIKTIDVGAAHVLLPFVFAYTSQLWIVDAADPSGSWAWTSSESSGELRII